MSRSSPKQSEPRLFLSFAARDQDLAREVAESLRGAGVDVVWADEVAPGGEYTDAVRRALGGSSAVVAVLTRAARRSDLPAGVLFEIGAAVGAGKRIFVITEDAADGLPFDAPHLEVLPLGRVDEIARRLTAA